MIITAICDACRTALEGETTSLQMTTGTIVSSASGAVSIRSTRSPAAFNLCETCVEPVRQVLSQLIANGQRKRAAAGSSGAPAPNP